MNMIKSERIAHRINKVLQSILKDRNKLVVAIDGYAGSGKTTVTKSLKKLNKNIEIVHLDDFIKHWKLRKKLIDTAIEPSKIFEYQWYRYSDLEKLVRRFKKFKSGKSSHKVYDYQKNDFYKKSKTYNLSKRILVIDGIFLLHGDHSINKLFDYKVYLDSKIQKADQRRIKRDKKEFGAQFIHDDHPGNWIKHYKQAYLNYIKNHKPQKNADMVFRVDK